MCNLIFRAAYSPCFSTIFCILSNCALNFFLFSLSSCNLLSISLSMFFFFSSSNLAFLWISSKSEVAIGEGALISPWVRLGFENFHLCSLPWYESSLFAPSGNSEVSSFLAGSLRKVAYSFSVPSWKVTLLPRGRENARWSSTFDSLLLYKTIMVWVNGTKKHVQLGICGWCPSCCFRTLILSFVSHDFLQTISDKRFTRDLDHHLPFNVLLDLFAFWQWFLLEFTLNWP